MQLVLTLFAQIGYLFFLPFPPGLLMSLDECGENVSTKQLEDYFWNLVNS